MTAIEKAHETSRQLFEIRFNKIIGSILELRKKGIGRVAIASRLANDFGIINEQTGKPYSARGISTFLDKARKAGLLEEGF